MTSITLRTVASYDQNAWNTQQYFVGNPLDRSCLTGNRKDPNLLTAVLADDKTKCLICSQQLNRSTSKLVLCGKYSPISPFQQLALLSISETLQVAGCNSTSDLTLFSEVVLLGQDESDCWVISIDVSSNTTGNTDILHTVANFPKNEKAVFSFCDARSLLQHASQQYFSKAEVALAGQVFAISGWHARNRFMGSTGQPTVPVECGMKRSISSTAREKVYPRIDPVAICLVISPGGESVLLGRMKRGRPGFFSCLSGFVDQCESVQEAVCREVLEESGILLKPRDVRLVDSQPWPLGRSGGCELMLGCIAQASSTQITIHDHDVEEVRWFSREEVRRLVTSQLQKLSTAQANTDLVAKEKGEDADEHSKNIIRNKAVPPGLEEIGRGGNGEEHINIPGEYAIAYHLIQSFVDEGDEKEKNMNMVTSSSVVSSILSPTVAVCRMRSLFLVPVLMFLFSSKISN